MLGVQTHGLVLHMSTHTPCQGKCTCVCVCVCVCVCECVSVCVCVCVGGAATQPNISLVMETLSLQTLLFSQYGCLWLDPLHLCVCVCVCVCVCGCVRVFFSLCM